MTFLWSVLGFLVAMVFLIAIHEAGHYFVARYFNIKVLQFSLGFGKPFWQKKMGETQFQISAIPLGGFVKFVDEREGPVPLEDMPRAFNRQSVYKRFLVVLAGPMVNLLFAWLAFSLIYFSGVSGMKPVFSETQATGALASSLHPEHANELSQIDSPTNQPTQQEPLWTVVSLDGQKVYSWKEAHIALLQALVEGQSNLNLQLETFTLNEAALDESKRIKNLSVSLAALDVNQPKQNWLGLLGFTPYQPKVLPVIGQILKGAPADLAGLQVGDQILSLDGVVLDSWQDLVEVVRVNPGKRLEVEYRRQGQVDRSWVTLAVKDVQGQKQGSIGVAVELPETLLKSLIEKKSFGPFESIQRGWQHSLNLIDMTLVMLKRMLFGEVSVENLSGPISIAQVSGQAMQSGWVSFLSLLGLLSLSLGVLNLLPIPLLDGGHLFFYAVEIIKGSPVNQTVEALSQKVGLVFILCLTFFAIFNDIARITNG